jgi:hypothetical protein
MAGTRHRPAGVLLAAVLLAGMVGGIAGCGKPSSNGGGGNAQVGGAPSGSPTSGAGATTPAAGSTTPAGVTFPSDAKSYTLELLKAWGNKDYNRIAQLAEPATVQQIKDASNSPDGYPNSQWTYIRCAAGESAGTTDCTWRNVVGDETVVRVKNDRLRHPMAVTQANLDRTRYPSDPVSYVNAFLSAWQAGNQQRMARLSSSTIKNYFIGQNPPLMSATPSVFTIDSTYDRVMLSGIGGDLGRSYEFKVLHAPGGKANAIKAGCQAGCAV